MIQQSSCPCLLASHWGKENLSLAGLSHSRFIVNICKLVFLVLHCLYNWIVYWLSPIRRKSDLIFRESFWCFNTLTKFSFVETIFNWYVLIKNFEQMVVFLIITFIIIIYCYYYHHHHIYDKILGRDWFSRLFVT